MPWTALCSREARLSLFLKSHFQTVLPMGSVIVLSHHLEALIDTICLLRSPYSVRHTIDTRRNRTGCTENSLQGKILRSQVCSPQHSLLGRNDLGVRVFHEGASFTLPKVTRSCIVSAGYAVGISKRAYDIRRFVIEPVVKSAH